MFLNNTQKAKKIKKESRVNHILTEDSSFLIKESYKATRTNIIYSMNGKGCKKIIISSSFPKEGKTTTCINLALTFAMTGAKVLLMDADLRKPRIHKVFETTHSVGVTDILCGLSTYDEAIIKNQRENLDLLIAGHVPQFPSELLSGESMDDLLRDLSEKYDYIFIDTPPINVVTDAVSLSTKVNSVFLVVRINVTNQLSIRETISKLKLVGSNVKGFIINDSNINAHSYKSKYVKYTYRNYR